MMTDGWHVYTTTATNHHIFVTYYVSTSITKPSRERRTTNTKEYRKKIARQNTIYFLTLCLTIWLLTLFLLFRITNHHNHMNSVCVNVKWRWRRWWWQWICMTSCVIFQNVRKSSKLSCFFLFVFSFDEVFSWMVSWRKLVKSIK